MAQKSATEPSICEIYQALGNWQTIVTNCLGGLVDAPSLVSQEVTAAHFRSFDREEEFLVDGCACFCLEFGLWFFREGQFRFQSPSKKSLIETSNSTGPLGSVWKEIQNSISVPEPREKQYLGVRRKI